MKEINNSFFLWSSTLLRLNKKAPCVNSEKIQIFPEQFSNPLLQSFLKMPKTAQTWVNRWSSSHSSINQVTLILLLKEFTAKHSLALQLQKVSLWEINATAWTVNMELCLHPGSQRIPSSLCLRDQTEEPILKLGARKGRRWEIWICCHMESPISPNLSSGLGRLQKTSTSSPLAALGQPRRNKHA